MTTHEEHQRPEPDHPASETLETAQGIAEMFEKDEPVRCTCHAEEKKSQKLSLLAAVCSFGALAISVTSLALPFLRSADDVTFDAEAWQQFLSTIEERIDDARESGTPASSAPAAPSAALPAPAKPKPVVVTTPAPTPVETKPVETASATTPTDPAPSQPTTEAVAANDAGTPAPAQPVDAGTPADAGTAEQPAATADGTGR